jgi:branched-chain amino acid transport system permease protein
MFYLAQILVNGLHNGMLYAVLAYGYVLIYMVTKRPNLAHGAIFAFAGQLVVQASLYAYHMLWLALPVALAFGAVAAVLMTLLVLTFLTRDVYMPLAQRSPNTMIAATLGVSIVLMEVARLSVDTRDLWLPPLLSDRIAIAPGRNAPALTALQWINIAVMGSAIGAAQALLGKTQWGRNVRAISQDVLAAALQGVATQRTIFSAIMVGSLLAVLAGILAVLYFGNMSFGSGIIYGLKVLFIAAAGGFASPLAAALGAFAFGVSESLWDGYLPIAWREVAFTCGLAFLLCIQGRKDGNWYDRSIDSNPK